MHFSREIQEALKVYDSKKGILRWLFGDAPVIQGLRNLSYNSILTYLKENPPRPEQASYQVYLAFLKFSGIDNKIEEALKVYDNNKGILRRLFGDAPAIQGVRNLRGDDDKLSILTCFMKNPPRPEQASYQVYLAFLKSLGKDADFDKYFRELYKLNLLNARTLDLVVNHSQPAAVVNLLKELDKVNSVSSSALNLLEKRTNLSDLSLILERVRKCLEDVSSSSQASLDTEKSPLEPDSIKCNLIEILREGLFTSRRKNLCFLEELSHANLITLRNIAIVGVCSHLQELTRALKKFRQANILMTQENFDLLKHYSNPNLLKNYSNPKKMAKVFIELIKAKLPVLPNADLLKDSPDLSIIIDLLKVLNQASLLTEERFKIIAVHKHPSQLYYFFESSKPFIDTFF